jgi:NTE family protein
LRAILDRIFLKGSIWEVIQGTPAEEVHKVVIIIVNAETQPDTKWDQSEGMPSFSAMMSAYGSVAIERYNEETIALTKENAKSWAEEIRDQRCKGGTISTESGSCGDIQFYVVEVKFDALEDETERMDFKRLPTSFSLKPEEVDQLREVAHRILVRSEEFQRFLGDLK